MNVLEGNVAGTRVKAQEDRVTDAYINEAMDLQRYKAEMDNLKERRGRIEEMARNLRIRQEQEQDNKRALEHLERFCNKVSQGLEAMTFEERQQLLRLVVERIMVEEGKVRIETVIPTDQDSDKLRNVRGTEWSSW
jgi:site-specific DNA recombinase